MSAGPINIPLSTAAYLPSDPPVGAARVAVLITCSRVRVPKNTATVYSNKADLIKRQTTNGRTRQRRAGRVGGPTSANKPPP